MGLAIIFDPKNQWGYLTKRIDRTLL